MTEKLYYTDSHLRSFTATVTDCRAAGAEWEIELDRTAFFPEGGGQRSDSGVLGGVRVREVKEREERIWHCCRAPLAVGAAVEGTIDWETRFARMQLHSGEHIVSGLAHSLYGCENVGFHMAEGLVTLDFDKELGGEQLSVLERCANEAVWANLPFRTFFPTPEELAALPYRSKKPLSGQVRIVEVEGVDRCACCAPHVERSGEVGMIRLTNAMRHRGGVRLTMRAGVSAWEEASAQGEMVSSLSALLSVPAEQVGAAAEKMAGELESTKQKLGYSEKRRMEQLADWAESTEGCLCLFDRDAGRDALREWCNAVADKCRLGAAFSGEEGAWQYVIVSRRIDLKREGKTLNAAIGGRGGGSSGMIQGSCTAPRAEIEAFLEGYHG